MKIILAVLLVFITQEAYGISNGLDPTGVKEKFPWAVALKIKSGVGPSQCAGALIGTEYVLTSAYCVDRSLEVTVIMGAHNISNENEEGQVRMNSRDVIIHEDWEPDHLKNDIALIKLPEPVQYTDIIKPLALYQKSANWTDYPSEVAGWGPTKLGGPSSNTLKFGTTHYIKDVDCEDIYGTFYDRNVHFCMDAKYAFCSGDEGGIVSYGWDRLVGVASFSMTQSCGTGLFPSVYTQIYRYVDWIKQYTPV